MRGLCSHTTPTSSHMGPSEKLKKAVLNSDNPTVEQKNKAAIALAAFSGRTWNGDRAVQKTPKSVVVSVNKKLTTVSYKDYLQFYEPSGFPIIEKLY